MKKFAVFDNNKPACFNHYPVPTEYDNNEFDTMKEAVEYLKSWVGGDWKEILPKKIELDKSYGAEHGIKGVRISMVERKKCKE